MGKSAEILDDSPITAESLEKALGDLVDCPICGQGQVFEKQASWYQPYSDSLYLKYLLSMYSLRANEFMALGNEDTKWAMGAHILSCKIEMTMEMIKKLLADKARLEEMHNRNLNKDMERREDFVAMFLDHPSTLDFIVTFYPKNTAVRRQYTQSQVEQLKE